VSVRPAILRQAARADIEQAVDHYRATAGAGTARGFIDAVERALAHLRHFPNSGSPRFAHELDMPGLRSWPLRRFSYLMFYTVDAAQVDVLRLLHGERDLPAWLRDATRD